MHIKGIIFDLDGVICSTDKYHYKAWKMIADEEGIFFDQGINERLRGVSRTDSLDIILEKAHKEYSAEEKCKLMEKKNDLYRELLSCMNENDVSIENRNTLLKLRSSGFALAIGSSSQNTRYILERIGLLDFFEGVSDGTIISRSKPDPEVFIKAAGILQLKNEECLVVEDAKAGIDAANTGGFKSAGIGPAASYNKATFSISSLQDICGIVNAQNNRPCKV